MRPSAIVVAFALAASVGAAAAPDALTGERVPAWRFHCDGTDPFLLQELDEATASGVGYGETWDETVCSQGALVLGDGYKGPRRPRPAPPVEASVAAPTAPTTPPPPPLSALERKYQDQFFAVFIPIFALIVGAACAFIAAVIVVFLRMKKQVVVEVSCPACPTRVPFVVGDDPHLFCPACGTAYRVDVSPAGGAAAATVPL